MVATQEVIKFQKPTNCFLCSLDANVHGIDFIAFKIRSLDPNNSGTIFEMRKDPVKEETPAAPEDVDGEEDRGRMIRYHFGPGFLDYKTIGATLEFSIGNTSLTNFRMIERHYFRDQIIKSFDFTLPFCIPNTVNTWEVIYSMPELSPELREEIIKSPWETSSDSFYFVEDQLVMHNKAEYNYSP